MVETFNPAPTAKLGEALGKEAKVIAQTGEGQPEAENLATKDPSETLLEGSQAGAVKLAADGKSADVKEVEASGMSYTEMGLLGGAFVAGAIGQKYGLNKAALATIGRGIESGKAFAVGSADLAPYARFAKENADIVDTGLVNRLSGWLRPGGDIIDGTGQVFMQADRTVVSTNNLLKPNAFTAINRFGEVGQFTATDVGMHSITSAVGKGPIRGFAIKHEAIDVLPGFGTTTVRDGNKLARITDDGVVLEGRGLFSNEQITAAVKQAQTTTSSLLESVLKTKKVSV